MATTNAKKTKNQKSSKKVKALAKIAGGQGQHTPSKPYTPQPPQQLSRDQFEIRTHKRLLDIIDPTPGSVESLMHLELPRR